MPDTTETAYNTGRPLCDTWRFLCDASYAVLPRDVAHQLGEFQKNLWGGLRWFAERNIEWVDECVRGGDRLREEWRQRHGRHETNTTTTPPPADATGSV